MTVTSDQKISASMTNNRWSTERVWKVARPGGASVCPTISRFAWFPTRLPGVSLSSASLSIYIWERLDTDQANWPPADRAHVTAWLTAGKSTSAGAVTRRYGETRNRPAIKACAYSPRLLTLPFTPYYSLLSAGPSSSLPGRAYYVACDRLRSHAYCRCHRRLHYYGIVILTLLWPCAAETKDKILSDGLQMLFSRIFTWAIPLITADKTQLLCTDRLK